MIRYTKKIEEKVDDLLVALAGNRITLLSRTFTTGTLIGTISYGKESHFGTALGISLIGSIIVEGITAFGITTIESYKRTKNHIKEFGMLDEKFPKVFFSDECTFLNYCYIQGVYLAAKKLNHLDSFNRIKTTSKNRKIPNF
ncbi:MAG: hypothetical protein QW727_02675 [Candidatus Pacearchaeota archaeon]